MSTCVKDVKNADNPFDYILQINKETKWFVKENKSASQYILYNMDCPVCLRFNQNTNQITVLEVRDGGKVRFNRIASTRERIYTLEHDPARYIQKITKHVTQQKPPYLTK